MLYEESQIAWNRQPSSEWLKQSKKSIPYSSVKGKYVLDQNQRITSTQTYGQQLQLTPWNPKSYYNEPRSFLTPTGTTSEEEDEDVIVDPGWEDSCLDTIKKDRIGNLRYFPRTRYCRI